jgi:hypothetical protein
MAKKPSRKKMAKKSKRKTAKRSVSVIPAFVFDNDNQKSRKKR